MNKKVLLLLPALALLLGGCNTNKKSSASTPTSSSEEVVTVESVTVAPAELELEVDKTAQLAATVKPITVLDKEVTWSSDHPEIASVNASGTVTALSRGEAVITATSNADQTKKGTCAVTVVAPAYLAAKTPEIGKEYRLGTYQQNLSKEIFFNGQFESYPRGKTTDVFASAKPVTFESAGEEGKYYLTYMDGETKKYIGMSEDPQDNGKTTHRFGPVGHYNDTQKGQEFDITMEMCVWEWNSELKTITKKITEHFEGQEPAEQTYFPGTYNTYDTISGCGMDKVDQDFVFQFLTLNQAVIAGEDFVLPGDTLQLAASFPEGVTETPVWSIAPVGEAAADKVTIDQAGLVTAAADAVKDSKYTVKVAAGGYEATLEITVRVLNYGTLENPLTTAEAKALLDIKSPSKEIMYVKGVVKKNTAYSGDPYYSWQQFWLDGTTKNDGFEGYSIKDGSDGQIYSKYFLAADSMKDLNAVMSGYGTIYNGTYELTKTNDISPKIEKLEGYQLSSTIAVSPKDSVQVEQGKSQQFTAVFEEGKVGGAVWSVAPVGEADATKATITELGKLEIAEDAVAGAQYTVTAALYGNETVKDSAVVTVKAAPVGQITLTAESLMGYTGTNIAYGDGHGEKAISGTTFKYNQLGCYGNGIQFNNKTKNYICNTTAFGKAIKKITITLNTQMADTTAGKDLFFYKTGDASMAEITSDGTSIQYTKGTYVYEVNPLVATDTYFAVYHHNSTSGAFYVDSIVIDLVD